MNKEDLALVPVDLLAEEILSRYDYGAMVLMKQRDADTYHYFRRWKGNTHLCRGLLADISDVIQKVFDSETTELTDQERQDS